MTLQFYLENRQSIISRLNGGIIVLSGYNLLQRSADMASRFEQEANFWYLTGISEPDWWVIIENHRNKTWLVAPEIDETHRIFEGGLSDREALRISGADEVIRRGDVEMLLRELAKKHSVAYTLGEDPHKNYYNFTENPAQKHLKTTLDRIFNSVQDCRKELAQLRAIKQPEELTAMKKAIRLTMEAFEIAKQKLPEIRHEYEIEAEFDYHFKKHGVTHAYDAIVAGGQNACTLHYEKNNETLKKNSLVLIDIGASYGGYSADITRTYAVGTPTRRQIAVHSAVERAHKSIVKLLKPGLSVIEYHEKVDEIMKQALIELRLMKSKDDQKAYRLYFPHAISHGLGIDPHDPLGAPEAFKEGMVLTVEPGIYIPEEKIGVRIEDDILITKTGHKNLSGHLSTGLV